jgi:magnesium transporter
MAIKENKFGKDLRWIDVCSPSREEIEKIKQEFNFNHHLLHDCFDPDHLPKYDIIEGVHFFSSDIIIMQ